MDSKKQVEAKIREAVPDSFCDCEACGGSGCTVEIESEHHPSCDGSCSECLCPVPVQVQVQCQQCGGEGRYPARPLNLQDCIYALKKKWRESPDVIPRKVEVEKMYHLCTTYACTKTFDEQSDRVFRFLHSLLC